MVWYVRAIFVVEKPSINLKIIDKTKAGRNFTKYPFENSEYLNMSDTQKLNNSSAIDLHNFVVSSLGRRKMVSDGNMDLHKRMKKW